MKSQIITIIAILLCSTQLFAQDKTASYEYDALNRLVTINYGNEKMVVYAYDKVGNRYSQIVDEPNSIEENIIENSSISIYPNPTTDNINIQFVEGEYNQAIVLIRDITGRTIMTKPITEIQQGYTENINVSSFVTGNYLVSILSGNKVLVTEKIIIAD
jgi:hypothetical protein